MLTVTKQKKFVKSVTIEAFIASKKQCHQNTRNSTRRHLRIFYAFLEDEGMFLKDITYEKIWQLDAKLKNKQLSLSYRDVIRHSIQQYLFWMHKKGRYKRDPKEIFPRANSRFLNKAYVRYPLPEIANEYIEHLGIVRARRTRDDHLKTLRQFYIFLENKKLKLESLNRQQVQTFFLQLNKERISVGYYNHKVCELRMYLRWLHEQELVINDPDKLITSKDYQKKPLVLPRPLEPEVDSELQKRLSMSDDFFLKGLLLMRLTGIRVGELQKLSFDCMQKSVDGYSSLKVPLGKMKTERLVPIDEKIIVLIKELQNIGKSHLRSISKSKSDPKYLLTDHNGRTPQLSRLQFSLEEICKDLKSDSPITSHRLRHSYATTLLTAGMNILEIKDLLGHKSINMTLIYAKVTQQNIKTSYYHAIAALESAQKPVGLKVCLNESSHSKYNETLNDIIKAITKLGVSNKNPSKNTKLLVKRIQSLKADLGVLLSQ
jgi:site-specific recombinase XerD